MTMPSAVIKGYLTAHQLLPIASSSVTLNMSAAQTGSAPAVGDFIFIFIDSSGNTTNSNTPSPPTGFAELVSWREMGTSTTSSWALYVKRRAVGETDYVINQININRTNGCFMHAFWVDGATAGDVANWVVGTIQSRAASGGTVNTIAPSVTTVITDAVAFAFGVERTSASETAADLTVSGTGWSKLLALLGQGASNSTITVASKAMASAGDTGNVTFTTINTQAANGAAVQIIIPGADSVPDIPATITGSLYDGNAVVSGHWYVMGSASAPVPLSWAGMVHPGYSSITEMLADAFFYCSHRGGSANFPEMSLHAYTQSAIRGYGAMEVSLARSSDGVWFGLHDASLDRTSLGTGGGSGTTLVASTMTWAAIQAYDIRPATVAPVDSVHKPYMRLEEILNAYLSSHILFIDPKAALAYRSELIALLKTYSNWQEKIVAKYVPGDSNVSWLADARAAGFVTNAMFYPTDNFTAYHAQGDILGMDYGASSGVWTSIKALGKPVMVHVCPNQAAVTAGITNGADGAMVSGVVQVPQAPM